VRPQVSVFPRRFDSRGWLVLAAVLAWAAASAGPSAAASHPHLRQGWLVGFGLGGGSAGTSGSGVSSNRESGFAASVRAGYAFNPRLSLELGGSAWTKDENGTTVTFGASGPVLCFYPGDQGLVLSAGVGVGTGEASIRQGNITISSTEHGLGVLGGIGYELRVTRRFALSPQIHAGWADLDNFNANWVNFELGFNWYFFRE